MSTGWYGFCLPAADFGKTRTGAEWVIKQARMQGKNARGALVGATAADVRDVIIQGESGILACSPSWFYPRYEPSKRLVTWPNGAIATAYSADVPNRLRGPQHTFAYCDEVAAWSRGGAAWDNLMFGLRLGERPRCVVTTTPLPIKLLRDIIAARDTHVTPGTTYDNLGNLAPTFRETILAKYEGTRLGKQELLGQMLDDNPNALWQRKQLDPLRVTYAPRLKRVIVGVDPAATSNAKSNNTGIIVAGLGIDGLYYVLEDATVHDKPHVWAAEAARMYHKHKADRLAAEVNMGGDLVEATIKVVDPTVAFKAVHASRSKQIRAEPIASLYEQEKVRHVGTFEHLEDEMCIYDPLQTRSGLTGASDSPDRLDALVIALTELLNGNRSLGFGSSANLDISPRRENAYKGM